MGGVYRTDGSMNGEMDYDPDSPVYQRGQQIMSVSTFVQEINDLRIASSNPNAKKSSGFMLPFVRVQKDTPAQINFKIRKLKRANRILDSSSEDESGLGDAGVDQSKQLQEEGNSSTESVEGNSSTKSVEGTSSTKSVEGTSSTKSTECRRPSRSGSESECSWFSSDSDLPDITEETDPLYVDRHHKVRKEKSTKGSSEKNKMKKKRKINRKQGHGSGNGELMKAARKDCMQKVKMYSSATDKDKRVLKEGNASNANSLSLREQLSDPHVTSSSSASGRMTGLVQLKPNAKSPKDVERESDKMRSQNTKHTNPIDHEVTIFVPINPEQEKTRLHLQNRMALISGGIKTNNLQNSSCKTNLGERNLLGHSEENADADDLSGNESEETVTYDADNKQQNEEIVCEPSGPHKRKAVFSSATYKRLRSERDGSVESIIENDGGDVPIKIQNVTGGVHDAFRPPAKELKETDVYEVPNNSANLEILKTELQMKEKKRGVIIGRIKLFKNEIAEMTEQLKSEEVNKQTVDKAIEELKKQIKHTEKSLQPPKINSAPIPPENQESPLQSLRQESSIGLNIISDASMMNFGVPPQTTEVNAETAAMNPILAAQGRLAKPPMKSSVGRRGRATPTDPATNVSVQNTSGGTGSDKIVGTNSHSQVISNPQWQVSLQQHLANLQKPPPSYAESLQCQDMGAQQINVQMQSHFPIQPKLPVQMGDHLPRQNVRPSHPQLQNLQPMPQVQIRSTSQHPTFSQALPVQTPPVVQQQQQTRLQTPSQVNQMQQQQSRLQAPQMQQQQSRLQTPQMQQQQLRLLTPSQVQQLQQQQTLLQTPSQVQQMQLSPYVQPQPQVQIHAQLNTPGMLNPSSNPSNLSPDMQFVFLPTSSPSQQGLILFPTTGGSGIILSGSPTVTSGVESSSTTSSITGVIPSTVENTATAGNLQKGGNTPAVSSSNRNPMLNKMLNNGKPYRPGPKSKSQQILQPEKDTAAKKNPHISQVPYPCIPLPVSSNRRISAVPKENTIGGKALAVRPTKPPEVVKPSAKSHLMVATQPTIKSGTAAAQAKLQPALPIIAKTHLGTSVPSHGEIEECSSSPETENSCFLCGSPDTFICCNNIVYCSKECKEKDWSRHKSECTNTSNS